MQCLWCGIVESDLNPGPFSKSWIRHCTCDLIYPSFLSVSTYCMRSKIRVGMSGEEVCLMLMYVYNYV